MRKVGWVVGLLLCASCQGSAEAKAREPPTRSEAFADCRTRVPQATECYKVGPDCFNQVQNCSNLIKAAEAAFQTGRWHPSQGPWANCGDRRAGSPYGRSYGIQCSYLDNIDKDPEFKAYIKRREEAEREREAWLEKNVAEKERQRRADVVERLEQAISRAAESIPGSVAELRTAVAKDGDLYENIKEQILEADAMNQRIGWMLGNKATGYETEISTLKERLGTLVGSFALQESKHFSKLTKARLRQYSFPKLVAQARICDLAHTAADEMLTVFNSDDELYKPLRAASDQARDCLTKCDAALARAKKIHDAALVRAEEIYEHMVYLCRDHPEQKRILAEAIRRKNQVDRESGTRNLALDRELAEQKIILREEHAAALRRLKQLGAPYSKSKCSRLE